MVKATKTPLASGMEAFAQAYVKGGGGVGSMLQAYPDRAKWIPSAQATAASKLLLHPKVMARIAELREPGSRVAMMEAADVLNEWCLIASADPRELVTHQRVNCRHCNGTDHKYQWRSQAEFWDALARAAAAEEKRAFKDLKAPPIEMPTDEGGYGWRVNGPVHPDCPVCDGEGYDRVFIPDLATLSPKAAKLYAGVKKTKDGIEVKMRDQDGALANIAKYLGMLIDRSKVDGNIAVAQVASSLSPEQAKAIAEALAAKI
jgi:phage terminase small subunit